MKKITDNLELFPFEKEKNPETVSPLPMQYMGSKLRIAPWIIAKIKKNYPKGSHFYDLFAGTGSVAWMAQQEGYKIRVNDLQPYSYAVLRSLFVENRRGLTKLASEIENLSKLEILLSAGRSSAVHILEEEERFLSSTDIRWQEYRKFSEHPILVIHRKDIDRLRQANEWNLFLSYYCNTYFGVRQCLELDTLRQFAERLTESQKAHLLASIISVMTYAVSSTTHLAQFLKPTNPRAVKAILDRRRIKIIDMVARRIRALASTPHSTRPEDCTNNDFQKALIGSALNSNWIIYVDPPYFKEHYSRYYHVLDTLYLYDYPYLTISKLTNNTTIGRYREDRLVSSFGLKSAVKGALRELLSLCVKSGAIVALSYASTSLMSRADIEHICKNMGYDVVVEEMILQHSGQGQSRGGKVTEFLFILKEKK